METFEISFFVRKENFKQYIFDYIETEYLKIDILRNNNIFEKKILFTIEGYEDNDYIYCSINFFGFSLTKDKFEETLLCITKIVTKICIQYSEVELVTAIFELTTYKIVDYSKLDEIIKNVGNLFPISYNPKIQDALFINQNVQHLY